MCLWCIIFLCRAYLSRAAALALALDGVGDGFVLGSLMGTVSLIAVVGCMLDTGGGKHANDSASDDDCVEVLCRILSRLSRLDIVVVFCGEVMLISEDVSEDDTCIDFVIDSDDCDASSVAHCVTVLFEVCDGVGDDLSGVRGSSCGYLVLRDALLISSDG